MRILFLTQVLPYPLDAGPKIRAYYTLRYLSQQHEITLLSFVRPGDPPEAVEYLRSFCQAVHTVPMRRSRARDAWHLLRSLAGETPFLIARDWVPEMAKQISDFGFRISDLDFVHADQLWMAPYALLAQQSSLVHRPPSIVLDQHNAVFQIPRRLAEGERNPLMRALLEAEWRKLARYEAEICQRFDHVVWVTEEDQQALLEQIRNRPPAICSSVIPICVDPNEQRVIPRRPDPHRVTFLGGMHWPPNAEGILWFAREVWPRVQAAVPEACLTVIGKEPPKEFRNPQSAIRNLNVPGYVDDPIPYLAETGVFIVPLHAGGGMRVKILDAWCWGLPVVTTYVGAEGIRVRDGENALIADTPKAFAQAVVCALREPDLAARLAARGRYTVEAYYNWRQVYQAWDKVYA
jgi:glycosyltransferase involved in cell wall biosynthesis